MGKVKNQQGQTSLLPSEPQSSTKSSTETAAIQPIAGIDRDTYPVKARAWLEAAGWQGVMIAPDFVIARGGERIVATVHEWGAWKAYFAHLGLRTAMDKIGYYMVPTQWPHLFDKARTPAQDYEAGNQFAAGYKQDRPLFATKADRVAAVTAARAKFPRDPRGRPTPKDHLTGGHRDPERLKELIADLPDRF